MSNPEKRDFKKFVIMHILLLLCLTAANVFIQLFYFEESFLALFRAFLVLFVIFASKNSTILSAFIPLFSYKSQPTTPFTEIANIPVYFLNTS